jgi:hypothetical protein
VDSSLARDNAPLIPPPESEALSFGDCGNCGARLIGPFCAQCGERKLSPDDYSVKHLAEEVLGEFMHFDTKFLRTLKVLLTKPGELSRAYFHGGRSRYTKPLTLFVIINVIFFLVQPHTGLLRYKYRDYIENTHYRSAIRARLLATREPEQLYSARFNANLQNQKKSLLIVSVPILALVMLVLFMDARRTYAEHLVFSIQVYAFLLTYLPAVVVLLIPVLWAAQSAGPAGEPVLRALEAELGITIITITGLTVYMYKGLRRAYGVSQVRAAVAAFALAWSIAFLTGVYRNAAFFATFWTT